MEHVPLLVSCHQWALKHEIKIHETHAGGKVSGEIVCGGVYVSSEVVKCSVVAERRLQGFLI